MYFGPYSPLNDSLLSLEWYIKKIFVPQTYLKQAYFIKECVMLYTNLCFAMSKDGVASLPNIKELTFARQVLFQITYRAQPLTGDMLALMLDIFTACWRGTTGFIFFCKIIPASCNPSSFLHSIFLKALFALDPEHRKLF